MTSVSERGTGVGVTAGVAVGSGEGVSVGGAIVGVTTFGDAMATGVASTVGVATVTGAGLVQPLMIDEIRINRRAAHRVHLA